MDNNTISESSISNDYTEDEQENQKIIFSNNIKKLLDSDMLDTDTGLVIMIFGKTDNNKKAVMCSSTSAGYGDNTSTKVLIRSLIAEVIPRLIKRVEK